MTPILSPAGACVIDEIARERTFLAFDFDGTLAPIVADRFSAELRPPTRALLRTVSLLYPCAVISGRQRADVAARLREIPLAAIVGNHGAEPGQGPVDRATRSLVAGWRSALARTLSALRGVEIEDKRLGLAVHFRRAASWPDAEARIRAAAAALEGAVTCAGHAVVHVLPEGAPGKGDAVRAVCERVGASVAAYVGDDRTDEDAFRAEVVRISVRVGGDEGSAAAFSLPDQAAIDDLLRALLAARARHAGLGDRWEGLVRVMAR